VANSDGKFGPSWKWIVGILAGVLIAVSGTLYGDVRGQISRLQEQKVDKDQYRTDVSRLEGKLDKLIDMQMRR
jgi:hypothetical protein